MVMSHFLRRGFITASNVVRTNLVRNATHKKLFTKKFETGFLLEKRLYSAYEGDGRTVGFVINRKDAEVLCLGHVSIGGFVLSNGVELIGSLIIFPHSLLSWNVLNASEVTEESLSIFKLLDPKVDILVFGYGSPSAYTSEIRNNFQKICKKIGIKFEALPTEDAAGLYNFLADERRLVAAALIPPTNLSPFRFEKARTTDLLDDEEEEGPTLITGKMREKKLIN